MPRETRIPNRLERRPRHRRCRRYVCPLVLQTASTTQTQGVIHIILITYTGELRKMYNSATETHRSRSQRIFSRS